MLPRLSVEGRLAADPELRFGQSGTAVCKLRLVASDRKKDERSGEWVDTDTLWLDVTAFDKLAENTVESVAKGDLVLVTGKLKTDEWTDRESGAKRSKITMIANAIGPSLQFRVTPHGAQQPTRAPAPVQQAYAGGPPSTYADEPPF